MIEQTTPYGISTRIRLPYLEAVAITREELAKEGFGILSEIDVSKTLRAKLDVDFRPYVILGACNPPLALRALTAERDIGLLLPCNVVVYADDDPERSVVAALDPRAALELAGNPEVADLAMEVRSRLERVLHAISAYPGGTTAGVDAGGGD